MPQDLEPTPPVPQDEGPFNNDPNSTYCPVNLSLQAHFGIGKDFDWLGQIPVHWKISSLKRFYLIQLGKMLQSQRKNTADRQVQYLKAKHVQWFDVRLEDMEFMWAGPAEIFRYGVLPGDLLVCEGGEGGRSGMVANEDNLPSPCIIQNALHRVRPREFRGDEYVSRNKYLQYLMSTIASKGWFDALIDKATIAHFTAEKFGGLIAPIPTYYEQTAIVRFLDHADRCIQRYIRAKERLIELLEEQKQAIIHQAVTGQIDVRTGQPHPAYKDSGVEWLGEVPEHWERRRLKTLLRSVDCRSTTGEETLLSLRRDHGVVVYSEHFARPSQGKTLVGYKVVTVGQLVVNRLQANNGLIFHSRVDGLVSPDYSVFEKKAAFGIDYLGELVRTSTYRSHFRRVARGLGTGTAGFLRLYDDTFLSTTVYLPPEPEQNLVIDWIVQRAAKCHEAKTRLLQELQLVREYRTRLIADVVTGKLDVRKAAASLPETDPVTTDHPTNNPETQVTTQGDIPNPAHPHP